MQKEKKSMAIKKGTTKKLVNNKLRVSAFNINIEKEAFRNATF